MHIAYASGEWNLLKPTRVMSPCQLLRSAFLLPHRGGNVQHPSSRGHQVRIREGPRQGTPLLAVEGGYGHLSAVPASPFVFLLNKMTSMNPAEKFVASQAPNAVADREPEADGSSTGADLRHAGSVCAKGHSTFLDSDDDTEV